jgi:hypothetical protein
MTIHILAYPDKEWKRLKKVVVALPIDANGQMVDGKPERLPKQISRHLLPDRKDLKSRQLVDNAILDFLEDLGKSSGGKNERPVKIERDRRPYTARPGHGKVHTEESNLNGPKLGSTSYVPPRSPSALY